MTKPSQSTERLLHTSEAADWLRVSPDWLARHRWAGTGPAFIRVGGKYGRAVRYRLFDLQAWIEENRVTSNGGGRNDR
jgi:hypothetical protein